MTKKTTKKTSKKTGKAGVPCGPSGPFDLERFKSMVIVALIAIIIGLTAAFSLGISQVKGRVLTDESATYLHVFPELADKFVQNLEFDANRATAQEMTGYGVSDEDGVFYIKFRYVYQDEPEAVKNATVYFWEDENQPGHYSYAFSYE